MLSKTFGSAVYVVNPYLITIEVHADKGTSLNMVGLPDTSVKEAQQRIRESIMPFEIVAWEILFWFLKFLVPKLIIVDKDKDALDELLNSVDLSTYGLERVMLNTSIGLDSNETELDPQNPNPRGARWRYGTR